MRKGRILIATIHWEMSIMHGLIFGEKIRYTWLVGFIFDDFANIYIGFEKGLLICHKALES